MKLYVSGPMSNMPDLNFPAFHEAAANLRAVGYEVVNPAELDAQDEGKTMAWADYLRRDLIALMACDGIVMLPYWERSKGARLELHNAIELGMDVMFVQDFAAPNPNRSSGGSAAQH